MTAEPNPELAALYEVDPATTDAERAKWNVPPLADALQRLERMNAERPPPAG